MATNPNIPGAGGDGPSPAEVALNTALSSTRAALAANIAADERGGGAPATEAPPAAPPPAPGAPPAPVAAPPSPAPVAAPVAAPPAPSPVAAPAAAPAVTPAPAAPPVAAPPEVLEVKVPTREEINAFRVAYVNGTLPNAQTGLAYDREASGWVLEWAEGDARLVALGLDIKKGGAGEIATLQRELIELEGVLKLDAIKNDDYERNQKLDQQRALRSELSIKQLERERLESSQEKLGKKYDDRVARYAREADGRINAHLEGLHAPRRIMAHATAYAALWGPAYSRVGLAEGIHPDLIPDFTEYAQMVGGLEVDRTGEAIPDEQMEPFLKGVATRFKATVDKHHRAQAADYARTATDRAAQPAPVAVPAGAGAPPALSPQSDPNPLNAVYAEARRNLATFRSA